MTGPWSAMDPLSAGSDAPSSSSSDGDSDSNSDSDRGEEGQEDVAAAKQNKEGLKKTSLDFEAISKHGYSGGPSVLYVPPPRANAVQEEQDWSWSSGKRKGENGGGEEQQQEEPIAQRDETWHTANAGAIQSAAQAIAEHNYAKKQRREAAAEARALSFSQKEKRKRDFGQASRGKNYVEEEKRILRDQARTAQVRAEPSNGSGFAKRGGVICHCSITGLP